MATQAVPIPDGAEIREMQSVAIPQGAQIGEQPAKPTLAEHVTAFFSNLGEQLNPVTAVTGMRDAVNHPVNTINSIGDAHKATFDKSVDAWKRGDHVEAARHFIDYLIPVLGPGIDEAGDKMQRGEYGAGLGQTVGIAGNIVVPEKIVGAKIPTRMKAAAGDLSERMYQSALKPSLASNSAKEIKSIVNTGLDNAIPVSEKGAQRIQELITNLDKQVKAQIASNPNAPINKFKVTGRLGDTADKFRTQVAPGDDLNAISKVGEQFVANEPAAIPASRAQALKRGTYARQGARAYGETGSATVEAEKALARGLKEELEAQFPEIKNLNAQEGKLINLDGELERALKRTGNHNLISLNTPITATAGAAAGYLLNGGESVGSAAIAAVLMRTALEDPAIKSKLAIAISKASKGKVGFGAAKLRVAGYLNALGNAIDARQSPDRSTQETAQ